MSHLIDHRLRSSLLNTLSTCHETRVQLYTYALNIVVFVGLTVGIGLTLYYCYKRKPTEYETRQKMLKDQDYILSKIRHYQAEQRNLMVTALSAGGQSSSSTKNNLNGDPYSLY